MLGVNMFKLHFLSMKDKVGHDDRTNFKLQNVFYHAEILIQAGTSLRNQKRSMHIQASDI